MPSTKIISDGPYTRSKRARDCELKSKEARQTVINEISGYLTKMKTCVTNNCPNGKTLLNGSDYKGHIMHRIKQMRTLLYDVPRCTSLFRSSGVGEEFSFIPMLTGDPKADAINEKKMSREINEKVHRLTASSYSAYSMLEAMVNLFKQIGRELYTHLFGILNDKPISYDVQNSERVSLHHLPVDVIGRIMELGNEEDFMFSSTMLAVCRGFNFTFGNPIKIHLGHLETRRDMMFNAIFNLSSMTTVHIHYLEQRTPITSATQHGILSDTNSVQIGFTHMAGDFYTREDDLYGCPTHTQRNFIKIKPSHHSYKRKPADTLIGMLQHIGAPIEPFDETYGRIILLDKEMENKDGNFLVGKEKVLETFDILCDFMTEQKIPDGKTIPCPCIAVEFKMPPATATTQDVSQMLESISVDGYSFPYFAAQGVVHKTVMSEDRLALKCLMLLRDFERHIGRCMKTYRDGTEKPSMFYCTTAGGYRRDVKFNGLDEYDWHKFNSMLSFYHLPKSPADIPIVHPREENLILSPEYDLGYNHKEAVKYSFRQLRASNEIWRNWTFEPLISSDPTITLIRQLLMVKYRKTPYDFCPIPIMRLAQAGTYTTDMRPNNIFVISNSETDDEFPPMDLEDETEDESGASEYEILGEDDETDED